MLTSVSYLPPFFLFGNSYVVDFFPSEEKFLFLGRFIPKFKLWMFLKVKWWRTFFFSFFPPSIWIIDAVHTFFICYFYWKKNLRRWSLNMVIWILLASVYILKKIVLSKKETKELIIKNIIFVRKTCKLTIVWLFTFE